MGAAARILIGVVGVPFLLAWCVMRVGQPLLEWFPSGVTAAAVHLAGILLVVVIAAGQAGTFAVVYLDLAGQPVPEPAHAARRWIAVAAVAAVAALALPTAAVVAVTSSQGPMFTLRRNVFQGSAQEIVWNQGQRPVIFTRSGAYSCDDDKCRDGRERPFSGLFHESLTVGVAADGARLSPAIRLAVGPDGTVLIAEGTNLVTVHL